MRATKANIKSIIKGDVPLLLEGPTGVGKTYMIMELAKEMGKTLHVINVSGELTVDTILGSKTLVDGNISWADGTMLPPMRKGDWILMDELNTALPEVLTIVNGVLDDSRSVTLPNDDNERVEAHKDFRFIATQNPAGGKYAGTGRLNDALLNRMVRVTVDYMDFDDEVQAIKKHTKLSDSTCVQLVKLAQYTRNRFDSHLSTRDLVKILRLRDNGGMNLSDAVATVALSKYSDSEFSDLRSEHHSIISDIREMTGSESKDPFDALKERSDELLTKEAALAEEKANLREAVRKELLKDLLMRNESSGTTEVPKEF